MAASPTCSWRCCRRPVCVASCCSGTHRDRRRHEPMMKTYEGGCHCGRVRFRVQVDLEQTFLGECNCSICTKKGILHLPVRRDRLEILSGAEDLTTYQFNTGVAKHTFCRHCGMHPFYNPRTDPENYSVNARCLDDYDPETMQPRRLFEGRNWEEAFARY